MSRFSPQLAFEHPADVRVRPVPEWGCLLVYTPSHPNLHYLDAHSWLIFELCDGGATYEEIRAGFLECVPDGTEGAEAEEALERVLGVLVDNHVVEQAPREALVPA